MQKSITDSLFIKTKYQCQCQKGFLNDLNGMLICEFCGFYTTLFTEKQAPSATEVIRTYSGL